MHDMFHRGLILTVLFISLKNIASLKNEATYDSIDTYQGFVPFCVFE